MDIGKPATVYEQAPPPAGRPAGKTFGNFLKPSLIGLLLLFLVGTGFVLVKNFLPSREEQERPGEKIIFWGFEEEEKVGNLLALYQKENPKVRVEYQRQSRQDYRERLVASLTKGLGPDLFVFHNTWPPMLSSQLSTLPSTIMDGASFQETFYPVASRDLKSSSGEGFLGIPQEFDGLALMINSDIFSSSAKPVPSTWDEFRKTALDLTKYQEAGKIEQAGASLGRTDNVDYWQDILSLMMLQNGANPASPVDNLAQDAISFFTIFTQEDGVWDATLPSSTQMFSEGKLAMYFGPFKKALEIKIKNPTLSFKVVSPPQLPKISQKDKDIGWASYWVYGVWGKSVFKDDSWQLAKFLSESNNALSLGFIPPEQAWLIPPRREENFAYSDGTSFAYSKEMEVYIAQAPFAYSWYLVSETNDGKTGLNSRVSQQYKQAVDEVVGGKDVSSVLEALAGGVQSILFEYGISF